MKLFLQEKAGTLMVDLKASSGDMVADWHELCKVTLVQIVLFNRRRNGKAERIKVCHFTEGLKHGKQTQEDLLGGLSEFEKNLVTVLAKVEIPGKFGRRVPVLFTTKLREQVECLLVKTHLLLTYLNSKL
ncbi:hypothetical protein V1264_018274 [Littorina saxatilis]|uniref:Uncharacterized protein n=1 Tax=Littorina saxatilis TaxID=31220 RepID=A0AAN9BCB1_9CAEN